MQTLMQLVFKKLSAFQFGGFLFIDAQFRKKRQTSQDANARVAENLVRVIR